MIRTHALKWIGGIALGTAAAMFAWPGGIAWGAGNPTVKVTFAGSYHSVTCTVVGGQEKQTVKLPRVSTTSLTSTGQTAGSTAFTIPLRCDGSIEAVRVYFQRGATTNANGNLDVENPNDPASAKNVQIQLMNGDGSPIHVGDAATMKTVNLAASTTMPVPFGAQYYATGATSAGSVRTYATFVIQMP
ncbi:fimbrial protein [Burkholderia ubonensis]|uniref:Fimbrial protein n=1 Tax=Burkholderia ubonensis subsp. mesacidophila TaxID=265293 RepID=A0A2A4FFJ1_9BURK|nr:fimbrial protein [Burkholderia ubonensis]PCE31206.1 fimbrial protein [Burkholderia ubonensis subsp. mesacidophila]